MSGFSAWLIQRLSAIYLMLALLVFLIIFLTVDINVALWQTWFRNIWVQLAVVLFAFNLLLHAWVGIRDVIIDYIHPLGLRLLLLSLAGLFLITNGFWLLSILWGRA